jgi:trigger factor
MPTIVRQDLDATSAILNVQITREELKPVLDSELKSFRHRAAIKGFRQGQAPVEFIKRLYGQAIFVDTFNEMVSKALLDYVRESGLDVLGNPLPTDDQQKFSFKISDPDPEYSVKYEIGFTQPFEVKGLDKSQTFETLAVSDLDDLAEADLKYARKRMGAKSNPVDDIQLNDILRVEAVEMDGKKPVPGGVETTFTLSVLSVADEKLKTELLSKKAGDTFKFNPRTLEDFPDPNRYRKYILNLDEADDRTVGDTFEGKIAEVSRVEDAELNQEFYDGYFGSGVTNQDEAINELKKGIAKFYEGRASGLLMLAFKDRLMELNPVPLPDQFLRRLIVANNEGKLDPESVESEYPAFASDLRWTLIRDKIKATFGIEVTEQDVYQDYANRVRNYFQADLPDHVIASAVERLMKDDKNLDETRQNIESEKLYHVIRENVILTDKPVSSKEFHQIIETSTGKAQTGGLD